MLPLFYVISHYSNLPFRAWEQRKLGDLVVDYVEKTSVQNQFPMLTSSQQKGIVLQEDYFANRQVTTENNIGYFVLPRGYFTFRSRSDNDVFVFNRNDIIDRGIISYFYPVFTLKSADSDFFLRRINNGIQRQLSIQAEGTGQHVLSLKKFKNIVAMFPSEGEQKKIGSFFKQLDDTIALHQRKLDTLKQMKKGLLQQMFPKSEEDVPKIRFADFDEEWYQRKLGEEFEKINERNDGSFGKTHWISVAKMYFVEPNKVLSNNIDTRTYVMRKGDIAFEGHSNTDFKFGRFVANDIGPGIVSELFPVYRHKTNYDNNYWKNAIQLEHIMAPIYSKSITSSGNSSNKLDSKHFLNQKIYIADFEEQEKIGSIFKQLDNTIILYQNKLNKFDILKKAYLQTMFI
ncbi:restriction endonuclease subunit S [Listeria monocytogenes]|uniref:Restriction endonuclease subunit S n=2 Tax=Listeria monocytogenes TaxID=1639 RepID=A0A3T1WDY5_LISMN|nr:restriction endonuclease subunit S [Listeria monocytogenes]EAG6364341.1 restriction endonuclease subunit S [Listeria monocytogenes LIS0063]EHC6222339.1 restriction endonuclease subunit S [Listeria monocytogenes serotype 1/2b]EKE4546630.1 restriction endonuclease subunit S [Listeria monocytogenes serotype 4b]AKI45699.1 type I restriction-modification system, S subunit [Listeria monocytogenes]EAA0083982.1 restriction endonuclease subunit S [Listeria monocytogenes]